MPSTITCPECETDFPVTNRWGDSPEFDDHNWYCDDCDEYHCGRTYSWDDGCPSPRHEERGIFNYSYKPSPDFRGHGSYFLGVELEISADSYASAAPIYEWARTHNCADLFYCKEDGSVDGFEIVTHPMTPTYFESVDWEAFMAMLNDTYPLYGSPDENEGHGLHVHISRDAFRSPVTLARWSWLINRERDHVERIARRCHNNWAQFLPRPVRAVLASDDRCEGRFLPRDPYRRREEPIYCGCEACTYLPAEMRGIIGYQAINAPAGRRMRPSPAGRYSVTNFENEHTVEVRIFRSTRNAAEFRDAVRLVYTSADFCACHATSAHVIPTWDAFTEYVRDNAPEFFATASGLRAA